jgi:hypothetical protein
MHGKHDLEGIRGTCTGQCQLKTCPFKVLPQPRTMNTCVRYALQHIRATEAMLNPNLEAVVRRQTGGAGCLKVVECNQPVIFGT